MKYPTGLQVHLILDDYGTHKHPEVQRWRQRHKRFHFHFAPTSSSWLNQVERWFRDLTDKNLRRGIFASVPELIARILELVFQLLGGIVGVLFRQPRNYVAP